MADFTPKNFFQKLAIIYLLVIVEKSDKSFSIKKSKAQKRKANLPKNLFVRRKIWRRFIHLLRFEWRFRPLLLLRKRLQLRRQTVVIAPPLRLRLRLPLRIAQVIHKKIWTKFVFSHYLTIIYSKIRKFDYNKFYFKAHHEISFRHF